MKSVVLGVCNPCHQAIGRHVERLASSARTRGSLLSGGSKGRADVARLRPAGDDLKSAKRVPGQEALRDAA